MFKLIHILLFLALILPSVVFAFETDQFNLPEIPLGDIGTEVHEYVRENVEQAMAKLNEEITARQKCLENKTAKNCDSGAENQTRLKYLRSDKAVARAVFNKLGSGIVPFTASGSWMESHKFSAQSARYKTNLKESMGRQHRA